jgi:hypothetical protein
MNVVVIDNKQQHATFALTFISHYNRDIATFWKYTQHQYPILSAMTRDSLAVQASSVPSERAFSAGSNLFSKRRCAMSGHTIEQTQFLKYYFRDDRQSIYYQFYSTSCQSYSTYVLSYLLSILLHLLSILSTYVLSYLEVFQTNNHVGFTRA